MVVAGETCPLSSAPGNRCTTASGTGRARACGTRSCATYRPARCATARSIGAYLPSTARSSGRTSRRPARGKKAGPVGEPDDHALGRSQGGFSTKLHLICDAGGTPLGVAVSPGQEHQTQRFVALLGAATAWPEQPGQEAGDQGYSADLIRHLLT